MKITWGEVVSCTLRLNKQKKLRLRIKFFLEKEKGSQTKTYVDNERTLGLKMTAKEHTECFP